MSTSPQHGRIDPAVEHFHAAVAEIPEVEYTESVQALVEKAEAIVDRWEREQTVRYLRLHFDAQAVAEHFEQNSPNPVARWSVEDLNRVGDQALNSDQMLDAFHDAVTEHHRQTRR